MTPTRAAALEAVAATGRNYMTVHLAKDNAARHDAFVAALAAYKQEIGG